MSSGWSLWGNDDITDRNAPVNNPITAFNFVLEVEGVYFMALKTVKVFNKENEYEYIREGGVNDYVHMRRKPISKPFTFQVERYVGTERFLDPLANGTELILPVVLYVYRHKARSEIIDGAPAWPARIYTFTGCVVTAKEYGELNSEKSAILTETTTIAYRELMVVTNPFEGSQELPAWEFPHDKSKHIFPENKYADTRSVDKDKNLYVKKEDAALDGMPVWQRNDEAWSFDTNAESTNKPFWSIKGIDGHTTQYADQMSALWSMGTYETGEDGNTTRVDSEAKKRLDSYEIGTEIMWGNGANMNASKHYTRQEDGSWKMNDGEPGYKPPWSMKKNKDNPDPKPDHAVPAKNGDKKAPPKEPIPKYEDAMPKYADSRNVQSPDNYDLVPGDDGVARTVYTGGDERFDKPPSSDFLDGDLPTWANATNAVSDDHYERAPGEGGWISTDDSAKPREIEYEDAKPKWADSTNAVSGDHYSPKPGEGGWEVSDGTGKPRWNIKENKVNPKPANAVPASNGDAKQAPKGPWEMKSNKDNPRVQFAKPATNGDGKQPPKGPWEMKANAENPKVAFAKPATNGDGKQPAKEPWDIKANKENPKVSYAVPAPNGDVKQTPVTWPPTRRALMAESLSKK